MYITAMTVDAGEGTTHERSVAPALPAIIAALRSLDGHRRTLAMLEHDEDHWLAVGGGNQGRYVVTVTDDDTFYLATSPNGPDGVVSLVVGGQQVERPLRETCDLAAVLLATSAYARDGSRAAVLTWATH